MDNKKAYKTELEKREILRLNNEESNKLTKEIGHEVTNELCRILENPEHKNDLYSMFLELE